MNFLLIEDNPYKISQIQDFINVEFPDAILTIKSSYHSGLKEVRINNQYNLILLDISMPTYDIKVGENGGEPNPIAGRYILKEMSLREISTKVIVVTMYENFVDGTRLKELDTVFKNEFKQNYCGYVYFAANDYNWKFNLKNKINELL